MSLSPILIGNLPVSRLILGANPFTGYSHQSPQKDREMTRYFNAARIKATLATAEALGVTTLIARADGHITRLLLEYWEEGGKIEWVGQTCPEYATPLESARRAVNAGAKAVYIHGGQMDFFYAQGRMQEACDALEWIKSRGLPAGIAAHKPEVHEWANEHIRDLVDFHMCSYFNPTPRDEHAAHISGDHEIFDFSDRERMVAAVAGLKKPAIHYKILAAGRIPPAEAFAYTARHLRPTDAVCVGIYPKDHPNMLREDIDLFEQSLTGTP